MCSVRCYSSEPRISRTCAFCVRAIARSNCSCTACHERFPLRKFARGAIHRAMKAPSRAVGAVAFARRQLCQLTAAESSGRCGGLMPQPRSPNMKHILALRSRFRAQVPTLDLVRMPPWKIFLQGECVLLTKSRCPPNSTAFATRLGVSNCDSSRRHATFFGPELDLQQSGSRSTDLPIPPRLPESGSEIYRGLANFQSKDASSPLAGFRTPATPLDSRAYGLCVRIHMRKDDAPSQTLARRTRRQAQEFEA